MHERRYFLRPYYQKLQSHCTCTFLDHSKIQDLYSARMQRIYSRANCEWVHNEDSDQEGGNLISTFQGWNQWDHRAIQELLVSAFLIIVCKLPQGSADDVSFSGICDQCWARERSTFSFIFFIFSYVYMGMYMYVFTNVHAIYKLRGVSSI
jgi:hypothetical protein